MIATEGKSHWATLVLFLLGTFPAIAAQRVEPIPVEDLLRARSFEPLSSVEWSPNGGWLAYVVKDNRETRLENREARRGSNRPDWVRGDDIWVSNAETGQTRNLTGGAGESWLPLWSPDGRYLAFLSTRDGGREPKLWLWNRSEDKLKKVSDLGLTPEQIEWDPAGRRVLVTIAQKSNSRADGAEVVSQARRRSTPDSPIQGSTVLLYQAGPQEKPGEGGGKSDPWDLDQMRRDLVSIDVANGGIQALVRQQKIATYKLSPDGSRIAYTTPRRFEKPGSQQILFDLTVVTIATTRETVVASDIRLDYDGAEFSWSPDSSSLSYHAGGPNEPARDCFIVGAAGGVPKNITRFSQGKEVSHRDVSSVPVWDKDGRHIYFVENGALWKASVTQDVAPETARIPDREVVALLQSPLADPALESNVAGTVLVLTHDDVRKQDGLYRIDLNHGRNIKLLERGECYSCAGGAGSFATTEDGSYVAYVAEDARHGEDLWIGDPGFAKLRRLTQLNSHLDRYQMGAARLIEWLDGDGQRLRGALLLPSDYSEGKRYPLIVWVYGGSLLSDRLDHFGLGGGGPFNFQFLATRGYAVLLPDSPQREGTPMADLAKTILPGVNEAIRLGVADPGRIGIMGQSNGGYSTLALLIQTRRFKAAIEMDGMADLIGLYGEMDSDGSTYGTALEHGFDALGGSPWEFRERYLENSPLFYLDRIDTPLLIVHGDQDSAVAPFLADQIFVALRRLGKEAVYAKYQGEGHSQLYWTYPNQLDLCNRMVAWFDGHLKPATPSTEPRTRGQP